MKIKAITLEGECTKCKKNFEFTADKIEHGYHTCDCDYPCDCKNGAYTYVEVKCPHCEKTENLIIGEELV
jgi:phage FluMu protein Com